MPRYLILSKSGVHRAACFALYRALLRQKHELQLNEHQQHLFRKPIRAIFKRNSKLQSPPQISTALQLGYETLEGLHDGVRKQNVLNRIFELASPPRTSARPEELSSSSRTKTAPSEKAQKRRVSPYPGAARTLARPFLNLSGRRHVPVLVNANRVPFLRLKKPQPPFLSRIIRDTVKTREHRIIGGERLASELPIAEDEDEWDQILYKHFGLDCEDPEEKPWLHEVKQAFNKNHKLQVEGIQKRADIAAEMYAIVEQEKALAEEEKLRIRDEKHKSRKARRLARRGLTEPEVQENLYPQTEGTVTRDAPAETQEDSNQVQEGARKPNTEKEWRKRGDKYKTSEELKRIYEASLQPKTDEEIARIKEARARRKEGKSERKFEKSKRKLENTAFWEQVLNNKAKHYTNKRLASEKQEHLDKKALSLEGLAPQVVGRIDNSNIPRQPEIPPLLEEPRSASGPASDASWSADKTGPHSLRILRPSLYKEKTKNH